MDAAECANYIDYLSFSLSLSLSASPSVSFSYSEKNGRCERMRAIKFFSSSRTLVDFVRPRRRLPLPSAPLTLRQVSQARRVGSSRSTMVANRFRNGSRRFPAEGGGGGGREKRARKRVVRAPRVKPSAHVAKARVSAWVEERVPRYIWRASICRSPLI